MFSLQGWQLFPASNPWNQNIAGAPVAANSAAVIANIGATVAVHPDWGDDNPANGAAPLYGIPVNIVHSSTPLLSVLIDNYPDESDITPVPIPSWAVLEGDYQNGPNMNGPGYGENGNQNQRGDSHLIIFDEDHAIAYELYGVTRPNDPTLFPDNNDVEHTKTDSLWHAAQETVWDMKTNQFRTLGATSADAAGLSILAGLVRPDEGKPASEGGQGVINHALRFTLPSRLINPQYIYPASHEVSVGSQATNKLPMGARLRLANTSAVNTKIAAMPPESQIIARAMQQYGLLLADVGSAMYVTGESATVDNVDTPNTKIAWNTDGDIFAANGLKVLKAGDFEVVDLTPRVTGLSATRGAAGGQLTITGQNFSGAAGNLDVFFGSTMATHTSVTVVSDTQITVTIPSGSGQVHITVRSGVPKTDTISGNVNANVTKPIFGYGASTATSADLFTIIGSLTWSGTANGNWTDAKWSGTGPSYPDANTDATLNTAKTVTVGGSQAANSLALSGGGQVTIAAGGSLAVGGATSVTSGAMLNVATSGIFTTGGVLTVDGGGSVTGGAVQAASYSVGSGTISARLAGAGGLTKTGSGVMTLSGRNTYQGPTTVSAGQLVIAGAALPTLGSIVIGGTSGAHATLTLAATDAQGNPLVAPAAPAVVSPTTATNVQQTAASPPIVWRPLMISASQPTNSLWDGPHAHRSRALRGSRRP